MVETETSCDKKWQSMLKNGKERTQYLYTSRELSDVDIFFPGDEEPVKVHSLVLCTNSPVFFAMLNGPMATGEKLTLPKDPRHSFQKLVDHMYLDRMDLESVEEALGVYAMAHKYEMESAMKDCVKYIVSNVKAETMPAVLDTSVLYENAALKKKCKEILDRDPDAVMLPETVSRLSKGSLRALLTDETLAFSSEIVPFRGLIAWGKAQLGQQEEPSGSALREKIGDDLLREVRFLDMSCEEIVVNVMGTDVLTHTECNHILTAICGADPSKFPMTMPLHPSRGKRQPPKEDEALKKCKEILDRDPDAVMLPETVSRLSKGSLRALLTDETLAFSSEIVPFRGLIAWGKAQLGQQEEPSGSALREKIGDDLLREVRFLDMSQDEILENVVGTDVLTHTECIHIQCAIRGINTSMAPMTMPLHPSRGKRQPPKEDEALKKCKEILERDPDAVMLPETVSRLSKEGLRALLTDETLAFSSEVVPFRGLIAWGKAQLGQQEEPSGSALREEIGDDLLREVRFLDMSCDEFVDHVVGTDVLTHTECIHILTAIRGADPSTLPRTTPLHPARGGRRGRRIPQKGRLSRFHIPPYRKTETMKPHRLHCLIGWLSSDRNIRVHRLDAPGAGTLQIKVAGAGGVVISSASSEGPEFVFAPPADLEAGKEYNVMFTPKTEVVANRASYGIQRVGNVTLKRGGGYECALYVCESGSSGCE
ncbi:uncharacterized protein LOC143031044 [Oratosquilla oratoria]|uniref:uncharacterized protein LOC143031044 n=1 Tax=Oratosquilla oratoria TaxID=337810 RepID=UPI003F7657C4